MRLDIATCKTYVYGTLIEMRNERTLMSAPMLLAVTPLPSPDTTPPVTTTYLVGCAFFFTLKVSC